MNGQKEWKTAPLAIKQLHGYKYQTVEKFWGGQTFVQESKRYFYLLHMIVTVTYR